MDCFIAPAEVTVNGERLSVCVVQEAHETKETRDLIAMLEAVMADSTSWFTRTVIEKLKALRHVGQPSAAAANRSDLDLLSGREQEVLGLICEGRSDVQMSKMLGLSENTVRNHIASLYRKIGVNRRTAAIIWARERGVTCRDELDLKQRRRPSSDRSGKSLSY
jgi:DNA-binding NarL/FixJ family response regulator